MASVRRFGSCSSCQLRNSRLNEDGRSWKSRSVVPEWLLGSRIKAQGEEGDDWKRETGAAKDKEASQAGGVCPLLELLKMTTETFTYSVSDNMFHSVCVCVCCCHHLNLSVTYPVDYIITYLKCAITSSTACGWHHCTALTFPSHHWLTLCLAEEFALRFFLIGQLCSLDFTCDEDECKTNSYDT